MVIEMNRSAAYYKRHLKALTQNVGGFLKQIDILMKQPSTPERGKKIAKLCNALEIANDGVRYSVLDINFRIDKKINK